MDCNCKNKRHGKDGCSIKPEEGTKSCSWCIKGCIKRGEG